MDYCSSCRRHLNGALMCPGCGAYAPDIAPPARHLQGAVASAATTREAWHADEVTAPRSHAGPHHPAAAPFGSGASEDTMADASDTDPSSGFEGNAPNTRGRAARRRQLARWKKHRRRAVAAAAVAIVGGGLTVAALQTTRPSTSQAHMASPPEPVTSPSPRTGTPDSSSHQPDAPVSRDSSTRPPTTTGRRQDTATTTPPTATTNRQAGSAATAQRSAPPSAKPWTPEPATGTEVGNSIANADANAKPSTPAPETTPPSSTERRGAAGPSTVTLLPTTPGDEPASPTQLCLLVVCLG